MANFALIMEITAKYIALTIILLLSLGILLAPAIAPEFLSLPLQAAGIAASFLRGAVVPRIWVSTHYLLLEFSTAVISTGYLTVKYGKLPVRFIQACTNGSLVALSLTTSFSALWSIAALVGFIGFEALFFLAVRSSGGTLGFFGRFHAFLWRLLTSFGVALLWAVYGLAHAGEACTVDQLLDEEERVEGRTTINPPVDDPPVADPPIVNPPIVDPPVGGRVMEEPEASPPPPYVSALPSTMFASHQSPIMQYTFEVNDDTRRNKDMYKLV